jgi:TonB family protein
VPELIAQLGAADVRARVSAAWELAGAGALDAAGVGALRSALDDPSEPVRNAAAWALGHVNGPGVQEARAYDQPPRLSRQTKPRYPLNAFNQRIQGTVGLDILIDAQGRVARADVRVSIPELDQAALECVREWQFEPARRGGRPVPTLATAPINFRITGSAARDDH